jgi:hypothetical protein
LASKSEDLVPPAVTRCTFRAASLLPPFYVGLRAADNRRVFRPINPRIFSLGLLSPREGALILFVSGDTKDAIGFSFLVIDSHFFSIVEMAAV